MLFLIITVIVLLLSCLLGWVVARISLKLKNKSFLTVFLSLVFIGGYYFLYLKANGFIQEMIRNADVYGARIEEAAYGLYLFGRVGEGDWLAAAVCLAVTAVLFAVVWRILSRSFLQIATGGGTAEKIRYTEKTAKQKTVFGAILGKEFARFTASPSYMLNCGLGILLLPVTGVLLLIKGEAVSQVFDQIFTGRPDIAAVLLCTALCLLASLNDMAAPWRGKASGSLSPCPSKRNRCCGQKPLCI